MVAKKIRIGELLVEEGAITEEQLRAALAEQKKRKTKLGRTLVDLGFIEEDRLLALLARQLQIPFVDLRQHPFSLETVRRLPETHARRFRAIVVEEEGRDVLVGMADPTDIFAVDEISRVLRTSIRRAVVRESDLLRILDVAYRRTEEIENLAEELREELAAAELATGVGVDAVDDASSAPVAKLLSSLFEDAVQVNASDIHIEPDEASLRIRQRVDGILHEQLMTETRIAPALVQRLKLISGLDISEKRLPQDGRFQITVKGRRLDVRLSTMPIQCGESVVMRLLDQSAGLLDLDELGMGGEVLARFEALVRRPHGMILVTGPTGSGKTTTLYAALSQVNEPARKIITVEDPVEYRIPRVNQVQVNYKIDLSFARVLRGALRQDPDVILVGEIRDQETAQIALRAAITGHLVLSTLHTNDAITSAIRLMDMGAQGYLVANGVRAVIGQRLVRRICESCAEPHQATSEERHGLSVLGVPEKRLVGAKEGRGCTQCNRTGYRGRIGVFELLEIDEAMREALRRGDASTYARAARASRGFQPLTVGALDYAARGITTLEEVLRVATDLDTPLADLSEKATRGAEQG